MDIIPSVTILMAIYKPNMKWLEEQLESLNKQTYSKLDLLVWNDCPDDETDYDVIFQKFIYKFTYKIYKGEKNLGSNGAFEKLTMLADSDYIAYCDQDDIWLPEKIEVLIDEAVKNDSDLLCTDMYVIDKESNVVADTISEVRPRQIFYEGNDLFKYFISKNFVTGCTTLVKTRFAKKALPFPNVFVHDWWLGIYVAAYGRLKVVNQSLIKYRIHGSNQTGVLTGVNNKDEYYSKRILEVANKIKVLKERFKEDNFTKLIENFEKIVNCRIEYFKHPSITNFINLYGYKDINKSTIYFELLLPFMPRFIFNFVLDQIRKGNI